MHQNDILNFIKERCTSMKINEQESRKYVYDNILKNIQQENNFLETIEDLKKKSRAYTQKLFSPELEKLKNKDIIEFLLEFKPIYEYFLFFPSKEIIERLKLLGVQREALKYFVDINHIKEQILKINSSYEIIISPDYTLKMIHNHLFLNGWNQVLFNYNLVCEKRKEGLYSNMIYNNAYDISRRKENSSHKITDGEGLVTAFFQNNFKLIECFTGDIKSAKKQALGILQGKTNEFLRFTLIDNAFFFTEKKQYHHLYELCRMLFPNRNLWKSEEFNDNNSLKGSYYNLKQYKNKMVKTCLGRQPAFPNCLSEDDLKEKLLEFQNLLNVTFWSRIQK